MSCDLFVFAGEKSGDLHGEKLLQALLSKDPSLRIAGVGGPRMRASGMQCVLPMEEFQVMGFVDVFLKIVKLIRQFYFVASEIERLKPKAVITIDYPGFNLRLHKYLKKKGIPAKRVHFICPSVWAWGKKRIPLMANILDLLLCILPFEKELFANTPLHLAYVGNPLTERIKNYPYKPFPATKKIIALFPGSRKKEIERNLPLILEACRPYHPEYQIALSISDEKLRPLILSTLKEKGWQKDEVLLVLADRSYELMKAAHLAIAKSGTVTLELALHRVPTVVVYAVSKIDTIIAYDILRIRLSFYCLVNIIAKKEVFSELIGPNFTLENIRLKVKELLDPTLRSKVQNECDQLIKLLGCKNAARNAAEEILQLAFIC